MINPSDIGCQRPLFRRYPTANYYLYVTRRDQKQILDLLYLTCEFSLQRALQPHIAASMAADFLQLFAAVVTVVESRLIIFLDFGSDQKGSYSEYCSAL